jgi:hypothetical protein
MRRHGNRNAVERIFRELKRRTSSFSNCFSHAEPETAEPGSWPSLADTIPLTKHDPAPDPR